MSPMTDVVSLDWQPERADWVETMRAHYRRWTLRLWLPWLLIAAASAAVMSVGVLRDDVGLAVFAGTAGLALPVGFLLFGPRLTASWMWRSATFLRDPMQAELSSAGIKAASSMGTGTIPWTSVRTVLETGRVFAVDVHGYRHGAYVLLPKRALPPTELPALRAALAAHLTPAGR